MPIRINLLAEAQALEDLRRRDPVKRTIIAGALTVGVMLTWSLYLQIQAMKVKGDLNHIQSQLAARTNEYSKVLVFQRNLSEVNRRLDALHKLAANRLLYGNLLNAMQHTTIDDVQLIRFRVDQSYMLTDEVKSKTNDEGHVTLGRPATSTEKVVLTFDARDSGPNPGDQVNKLKKVIADYPYFQSYMGKTNEPRLTSLSPPQALDGKPCVQFTLECRFPDRTR